MVEIVPIKWKDYFRDPDFLTCIFKCFSPHKLKCAASVGKVNTTVWELWVFSSEVE